jgi:hypothetical protein
MRPISEKQCIHQSPVFSAEMATTLKSIDSMNSISGRMRCARTDEIQWFNKFISSLLCLDSVPKI